MTPLTWGVLEDMFGNVYVNFKMNTSDVKAIIIIVDDYRGKRYS